MASSSLHHALGTAASWLFAAACCVVSVVYFDELKAIAAQALGLEITEQIAAAREAEPARSASRSSGSSVELRASGNGHFVTTAYLNGRPVEVMVDTGASIVAMSYEDAQRAGVYVRPSDFTHQVSTANGHAKVAPVMLDSVSIGDITVRNVRAAVAEPGRLGTTLLGMTFLGRLSRTEMRRGTLVLEE